MKIFDFFFFLANGNITDEGIRALKDLENLEEFFLGGEMMSGQTLKYLVTLKKLDLMQCYELPNESFFDVIQNMSNLKEILFYYHNYEKNPVLINFWKRIETTLSVQ